MYVELSPSELQVLRLLARKQRPLGYWQIVVYLEREKRLHQHVLHVLQHLQIYQFINQALQPGFRYAAYQITDAGFAYLESEYGDVFEPP